MRIVTRREFLDLPKGTVFQSRNPVTGHLSFLAIKGDVIRKGKSNDFLLRELLPCEVVEGEELGLPEVIEHEGFFDDRIQYAVYEKDDLAALIHRLNWPEKAVAS